jgi:SAM-dependent methyltransferase
MLPYVPAAARTILDVGCGEGLFGARLREGSERQIWGIESDGRAAEEARSRLDRVVVGDVMSLLPSLPIGFFDVAVFNDVLEHLVDPFGLLSQLKRHLRPGGVVVSSIPDIRFYPTLFNLVVRRRWEYEESGILDLTLLRFFTTASIRAMYGRLGYEVLRHEGINPMTRMPWGYHLANLAMLGRLSDTRYVQFATVARPLSNDIA